MRSHFGEVPDFIVLPARSRRGSASATTSYGDQLEQVVIGERCQAAVVIYAADLRRALAVATNLRSAGHQLILVDLHATVAESVAEWRNACANVGTGQTRNGLSYSGTVSGLESYLTDLALMRAVDGAIVSVVKCSTEQGEVTSAGDITDLVLAEFSDQLAPPRESPAALAGPDAKCRSSGRGKSTDAGQSTSTPKKFGRVHDDAATPGTASLSMGVS
jgi:hypothetical protein